MVIPGHPEPTSAPLDDDRPMWPQGVYPWWEFTLIGILVCMPVVIVAASGIGRKACLACTGALIFGVGWPIALATEMVERVKEGWDEKRGWRGGPSGRGGPGDKGPEAVSVGVGGEGSSVRRADSEEGGASPLLLQHWDASPRSSLHGVRPQCLVDLGPPLPTPPAVRRSLGPLGSSRLANLVGSPVFGFLHRGSSSPGGSTASGFREGPPPPTSDSAHSNNEQREWCGGAGAGRVRSLPLNGDAAVEDVYAIPESVFETALQSPTQSSPPSLISEPTPTQNPGPTDGPL